MIKFKSILNSEGSKMVLRILKQRIIGHILNNMNNGSQSVHLRLKEFPLVEYLYLLSFIMREKKRKKIVTLQSCNL